MGEPQVCRRVIRIQVDGPLQALSGAVPVPFVQIRIAQRGVRLGQFRIHLKSAARGGDGQLSRFRRGSAANHHRAELVVAIRQTRISAGVRGIARRSLLKQGNGLGDALGGALVQVVPRAQIVIERRAIDRGWAAAAGRRGAGPDLMSHGACDLLLKNQHVGELPIVGLRPEMPVGGGMNELHGDPQTAAGTDNATLRSPRPR